MLKKIFFYLFYLQILAVFSQGYKHFSIENGLPSNRIYKIVQEKQGFIWIATDKGISKFNGKTFKNFTTKQGLPTNDIWDLFLTDSGKIWFFARTNKLGYIQNDSIKLFKSEHPDEVFYPHVNTNRQKVFFTSFGKTYILKDQVWKPIFQSQVNDSILSTVYVMHPEIKYINITKNEKLFLFNHKNKLIKKIDIKLSEHKDIGQINDSLLFIHQTKNLYVLNLNTKVLHEIKEYRKMDPSNFYKFYATDNEIQFTTQAFYSELDKNYQLKNIKNFPNKLNSNFVFKDTKGNFWVITYNKGIYLYPKNFFNTNYYLTNEKIKFLKKTPNGKIIAGVLGKGLYKYDKNQNKFELVYAKKEYIYDVFFIDKNNFVIFGKDTTLVKKEGKIIPFYFAGKKAIFYKNNYFTTTYTGLYRFDNELNFIKQYKIPDPNILFIYNNTLIIGGISGLYKMNNDTISKINFEPKYSKLPITCLNTYKNNLLIGTDGSGLFSWDGKNKIVPIQNTQNLIIQDILVNNDEIWLATQEGVLGFKFKQDTLKFIKTIRKFDGLPSDQVIDIEIDQNNLLAASYNGISSFDLYQEPSLPLQNLYFKEKKYGNDIIKSDKNKFKFGKNKNLKIKFATIDFSGQEHNKYYYKLEPIQSRWNETEAKDIDFNNLPPSDYNFKIKVSNPYGQILTNSFDFSIQPLWWQTGWAKLLFIFSILSIISFFIIGYRKKELTKQRKKLLAQKERVEFELYALRSQMNPHFVFNSLNAIQYYINDGNYDKSETYLVKFSRLIRMIFDFSRYKTVRLDQEIKLLKSYLEIEKMRFGENFNFCIKVDNDLPITQMEIPTMLLQPIVENAVNHGIFHKQGKGTICMEFKKITDKTIEVIISDDGIGIKKSKEIQKNSLKKHKSRSTQILKKRIELLNMSGKWKISYQLEDLTSTDDNFNTRVKLKITKL